MSKYNISKFNIKAASQGDQLITMNCTERIQLMYTMSLNTKVDMRGTELLKTSSIITSGVPVDLDLKSETDMNARIYAFVVLRFLVSENLESDVYLSEDIGLDVEYEEAFKTKVYVGKNIDFELLQLTELGIDDFVFGKDFKFQGEVSEELIVNASSTILDHYLSKLNVTLQPGESIVIDYDRFTVYKGEENMLDEFSGHWFELSRKTASVDLSATGEISGKMYYKERYL